MGILEASVQLVSLLAKIVVRQLLVKVVFMDTIITVDCALHVNHHAKIVALHLFVRVVLMDII